MKAIRRIQSLVIGASIFCSLTPLALAQPAPALHVKLVPQGVREMKYGYTPIMYKLSSTPPSSLLKAPKLSNPAFGELKFGPIGSEVTYIVILDRPEGEPAKFYFDANHNGDLTDDPAIDLTVDAHGIGSCYFWIDAPQFGKHVKLRVGGLISFGKEKGPTIFNYYSDYAWIGTIDLGGKTYKGALYDIQCVADFSRPPADAETIPWGRQYDIWIDLNGDGKVNGGERFPASKPFNISGTTYEVTHWAVNPTKIKIGISDKMVAELPMAPKALDIKNGSKFISINAKAMDGQTIDLPTGYKGKVVLVDFWATWCGPCMDEVPNVVKNYQAYKDKGFEVLGISLDRADSAAKILEVTRNKGMSWPEIYEGKYWDVSYVKKLGIEGIPQAYLIDGTTGAVLAQGDEIRGEKLAPAIEKALASRK